jgi:hypothetical protein
MKETHSAAIIFLLAAILSVLLFGANVVLAGTGAIIAIGIALAAIVAVIVFSGIIISKLPGFAAGFLRGWIKIVAAPVTAPVQYWRTIRDRRSRGERVNLITATIGFLYTSFAALMASYIAIVIPTVIVVGILVEVGGK